MRLLRSHSLPIRPPLRRPPTLANNNSLATTSRLRNLLSPLLDEVAGALGEDVAVEKGVAVYGAEVGGCAEGGVVFHGDHGVDGDDGAAVAGGFEGGAGGGDGGGYLACGCFAAVYELVAYVDGVYEGPVAFDGGGDCLDFALDRVYVKVKSAWPFSTEAIELCDMSRAQILLRHGDARDWNYDLFRKYP